MMGVTFKRNTAQCGANLRAAQAAVEEFGHAGQEQLQSAVAGAGYGDLNGHTGYCHHNVLSTIFLILF